MDNTLSSGGTAEEEFLNLASYTISNRRYQADPSGYVLRYVTRVVRWTRHLATLKLIYLFQYKYSYCEFFSQYRY